MGRFQELTVEQAAAAVPRQSWRRRYPGLARFARSNVSILAFVVIVLIVGAAMLGPILWPHSPTATNYEQQNLPPSWEHPAGTDFHGRDLLARLFVGARISLAVGVVSMVINLFIGVGIGTTAAWLGGKVDAVVMRIVDGLYSIPLLLTVIILQIFVKPLMQEWIPPDADVPLLLTPDLVSIYVALGVSNWLTMARLSRSEVLNQAKRDYVSAAEALGAGRIRTLFRHVLPNCMAPLLVAATLAIPEAIFIEAFLSFIGLGVSQPLASWGALAADAVQDISTSSWMLLYPAAAISLTMLAFNLFGDGLRDAFDPSRRD